MVLNEGTLNTGLTNLAYSFAKAILSETNACNRELQNHKTEYDDTCISMMLMILSLNMLTWR